MPTHEELPLFLREYKALAAEQRAAFKRAVQTLAKGLKAKQVPSGLRVKAVGGYPGVWEITWAGDGRATFSYGDSRQSGEPHIIWRRIGTHAIFREP